VIIICYMIYIPCLCTVYIDTAVCCKLQNSSKPAKDDKRSAAANMPV